MQSRRHLRSQPQSWHHRFAHILVVAIALLGVFATSPNRTEAHARLIASSPAGGSALAAAPSEFRLQLSEPVDLSFSNAQLLAADGTAYPLMPLTLDPGNDQVVTIGVGGSTPLPNGVYTLVWRMMSATDGHATTGTIAFSVGTGEQPAGSTGLQETTNPPWWRIGIRWVSLLSLMLVAGGLVFLALIARPVLSVRDSSAELLLHSWRPAWIAAFAVALISQVVSLHDQAVVAADSRFLAVPAGAIYQRVLVDTTFGTSLIVRMVLLVVLYSVVGRNNNRQILASWTNVSTFVGLLMLLTTSVAGHAAGEGERTLAILVDWIHFSGAAIWFGGLCFLFFALIGLSRRDGTALIDSARLLCRFSSVALLTFCVLTATGFVNTLFHVSGPRTLRDQDYGVTLIVKVVLVLAVIVPAALNLLMIRPRLLADGESVELQRYVRMSVSTVGVEVVLGCLIVIASASLTELPPADGPMTTEIAAKIVTVNQRSEVNGVGVWLLGRLDGASDNRFTVTINNPTGTAELQRIIVETVLPAAGERGELTDRFDAEAVQAGTNTYFFPAVRLGLQGVWNVHVLVRRAGVEDVQASFVVDTSEAGIPAPRVSADSWRMPRVPIEAWGLFVLSALVAAGGIVGVKRLPGLEPLAAALILTMVTFNRGGFRGLGDPADDSGFGGD